MVCKIRTYNTFEESAVDILSRKPRKQNTEKQYSLPKPFNVANGTVEARVLKDILEVLTLRKIWHIRIDSSGKITRTRGGGAVLTSSDNKGQPDILCGIKGKAVYIEVKRLGGKYSASQLNRWRDLKLHTGATILVATHFTGLIKWLEGTLKEGEAVEIENCAMVV